MDKKSLTSVLKYFFPFALCPFTRGARGDKEHNNDGMRGKTYRKILEVEYEVPSFNGFMLFVPLTKN